MTGLHGSAVIVTGAGGGVGRGIALACAEAGGHVVIASPGANGGTTAQMIRERGGLAVWVECDVTVADDVVHAVRAAVQLGPLAAVVHNAMSRRNGQGGTLAEPDWSVLDDHLEVTLRGAFHCAKAAKPALAETGGSLVLLTSAAGMEGNRANPFYTTVKAATRGMVKSLAREWGPLGIRVNCMSVLARSPAVEAAHRLHPNLRAHIMPKIALGRLGDPEADVGPAAVFLCSQDSRYVTGQTLVADGGRYMGLRSPEGGAVLQHALRTLSPGVRRPNHLVERQGLPNPSHGQRHEQSTAAVG